MVKISQECEALRRVLSDADVFINDKNLFLLLYIHLCRISSVAAILFMHFISLLLLLFNAHALFDCALDGRFVSPSEFMRCFNKFRKLGHLPLVRILDDNCVNGKWSLIFKHLIIKFVGLHIWVCETTCVLCN